MVFCRSQEDEERLAVPGTTVGFFHVEVTAESDKASPGGVVEMSLAGVGRGKNREVTTNSSSQTTT